MLYPLARTLMFKTDPEAAHDFAVASMNTAACLGLPKLFGAKKVDAPVRVMGLDFPNAVGLAAGLDKNAVAVNGLASIGFGFIEVGTVTPKAQLGNPKPRMFRLSEHQAIINRMGFNNDGVDNLLRNLEKTSYKGILGINIGKNKDTPNEHAHEDYLTCLRKVYDKASYITLNISSPNTPGLRTLQYGESLNSLLDALKSEQKLKTEELGKYVPIAVKIAPDMTAEEISLVAASLCTYEMDGVIATNTTLDRDLVVGAEYADETGGLSGAPVFQKSNQTIRLLAQSLEGALPIIGVGGIQSGAGAAEKIAAGASLVQIYTGLIYQGPQLVAEAATAIKQQS